MTLTQGQGHLVNVEKHNEYLRNFCVGWLFVHEVLCSLLLNTNKNSHEALTLTKVKFRSFYYT